MTSQANQSKTTLKVPEVLERRLAPTLCCGEWVYVYWWQDGEWTLVWVENPGCCVQEGV